MRRAVKFIELLSVFLLGALVFVPFAQVVMRDTFNAPIIGAEEFTRFLLICVVFVAYPLVVESGENIVMGELRESMPQPVRTALNFTISVAAVIITGFIAFVVLTTIGDNLNNATPTLKIPFWLFLGSTLFGFAAAALVHAVHLRKPPQKNRNVSL